MTAVATPAEPAAAPAAPSPAPAEPEAGAPTRTTRRDLVLDVVLLGGAGIVALSGFQPAFGGTGYLVVGVIGLAVGILLALAAAWRQLRWWWVALLAAVIYLVIGGPLVVPERTIAGVVPTPGSVQSLADAVVRGWLNLVTTVPPVGGAQNLYAVPFLCGLLCGLLSLSIARRARRFVACALLPPLAVLIGAVLMGVDDPAWPLQATVFAGLALVWGSARQRSARTSGLSSNRSTRWVGTIGVLAVAGTLGLIVGTSAMVVGSDDRFVLRDHVDPPVDLQRFASPLEGFRSYLDDARRDDVVFRVEGLRADDRIRLATLDSYDGVVWHVLDEETAGSTSGVFERVGEEIPVDIEGDRREISVEVAEYTGPWLPTLYGAVERVSFEGDRAGDLADGFRFNLVTGTAAEPEGVQTGDAYRVAVVVPPDLDEVRDGQPDPTVVVPDPVLTTSSGSTFADLLTKTAQDLGGDGGSPLAKVRSVEAALTERVEDGGEWYFSDGDDPENPSRAGHSIERLSSLLGGEVDPVGNEEQYAAVMALMADRLGMPARVVVGFEPEVGDSGVTDIVGADITAWAEVAVDGVGWVPLYPTPPETNKPKPEDSQPIPPPDRLVPPPPSPTTTVVDATGTGEAGDTEDGDDAAETSSFEIPTWAKVAGVVVGVPLLLLGAVTGAIGGAKARRRRRRRSSGTSSTRIAAGWVEVCDLACDLGDVTPDRATRRETAVILGRPGVSELAQSADTLVFGPVDLGDGTVEDYWGEVELTRRAMLGPLGRIERWKALVNPSSLRRRAGVVA